MSRINRIFGFLFLGLCFASPGWGASGTPIPLTVSSATVRISNGGPTTTGPLPISLPFDGTFNGCIASGTVEVSIVGGILEIRAQGLVSVSGSNCGFEVFVEDYPITWDVPDVGEATTPVLLRFERTSAMLDMVQIGDAWTVISGRYQSALGGGLGFIAGADIFYVILFPPFTEGFVPADFIPGDTVLFDPTAAASEIQSGFDVRLPGGSGTFDVTHQLSASLPPAVQSAAIPPYIGWLICGILIGLGIKVLRRPARAAAGAGG